MADSWHVAIDTGGTFTDVVLQSPTGDLVRSKLLSSGAIRARVRSIEGDQLALVAAVPGDLTGFTAHRVGHDCTPEQVVSSGADMVVVQDGSGFEAGDIIEFANGESAPVLGVRLALGIPMPDNLPEVFLRLGTTRGTNALLERRYASTAFFTTRGFSDLLRIGTQQRPDIFALPVVLPPPVHSYACEVQERLAEDGRVLEPVDVEALRCQGTTAVEAGCTVAAVALLHAWRNDEHEQQARAVLVECGFKHVSLSSELSPTIRLVPRAQAAVVDAAIEPPVGAFLRRVRVELGEAAPDVLVMGSAGGLTPSERFHPKDALLSGPAGGVVGAVAAAAAWGFERVLTFDMGGTSTDVARFDRGFVYVPEQQVGLASLATRALDVHTVAAGGGSVCHVEEGLLEVGPQSGSAEPGPACYGRGGPLCLTDINLLAGRLDPGRFGLPLDIEASRAALAGLHLQVEDGRDADAMLDGFLARADRRMADALGRVSLRQGCDPGEYVLVAFGGAGAQHACAVAEGLDINRVLLPAGASVLSAEGIAGASIERSEVRQVLRPLAELSEMLPRLVEDMTATAMQRVVRCGIDADDVQCRRVIMHLRLAGQDSTIDIDWSPAIDLAEAFMLRFKAIYGYAPPARSLEVESIHVLAGTVSPPASRVVYPTKVPWDGPGRPQRIRFDGRWIEGMVVDRSFLETGHHINGPALLVDDLTTVVVPPSWSATRGEDGGLLLEHDRDDDEQSVLDPGAVLERHADAFTSIASDMGVVLDRCAISVNVKERRDYSCTLHDPEGRLVVNAPHLPVHLGSMGVCVRRLAEVLDVQPGDVLLTNHPRYGGSHLPDITVVTPVHGDNGALLGWTASRAHHAELGGTRPGSMPPDATTLREEGVVLPPMKIVKGGISCLEVLGEQLATAPWPSRAIEDNLADVQAAIAANHRGAMALQAIARDTSEADVIESMDRLQARSARMAEEAIGLLPSGHFDAVEHLDDGTRLAVAIDIQGERARVDFTGTDDVHPGNLNATDAIVRSVVLYVLRLLVGRRVPLNEGLLKPVEIVLPHGLLNPCWPEDPGACPAVVGGNVETSQRLVDLLLKALSKSAAGQGTMNNTLFGTDVFGYYETLGGGHGATEHAPGASGAHCHMSNTRITDPEVFEHRFPVRLHRFALRSGSGGAGRFSGGEGLERIIEFLEPVSLSMLTQHRTNGPFGMQGGETGAPGEQFITRSDGSVDRLDSSDARELAPGDTLTVRTPGGGGWGMPGSG